jgi:patatin-like phospholipase/acyl hydrolase
MERKEFKILSIDGGGIKGIIPAIFLEEVEKAIKKPIWEYFDLICGTSTGGIIALAISTGKPVAQIRELYEKNGKEIFPPVKKWELHKKTNRLLKIVCGEGGKYCARPLSKILKETFTKDDKPLKMRDSKTFLCIPSVDISTGRVVVFKTPHKVVHPVKESFYNDADKEVWKVARATSAAPFYFASAELDASYYIDGGLWANNPSLVGIVEARRCGYKLDEISLLSLGTGSSIHQVPSSKAKRMNLLNWQLGIIELAFEVQSQSVENQVCQLLMPDNNMRVQYTFSKGMKLDDVNKLNDLITAGSHLCREYKGKVIERFFKTPAKREY